MAGKKREKDHLRERAGVALVETIRPPTLPVDPLRWWTKHPTDAVEIDLHEFANGQTDNPLGSSNLAQNWGGPFSGRPSLIRELAPALRARSILLRQSTWTIYAKSLRAWWRLLDTLEATPLAGNQRLPRVESVADLGAFHEAAAHQGGMHNKDFSAFRLVANDARKSLGLPRLVWIAPDRPGPDRQLISDAMARVLRIEMKRNWVKVLRGWALRDEVRAEAERRECGEPNNDLGNEGERLLHNWREFQRIALATGEVLPSGEQLADGRSTSRVSELGLSIKTMRGMQFPDVWEVDAAYHLALFDSGWNPSTLLNLDASDPHCVAPSLKADGYHVLHADDDDTEYTQSESLTISAAKPRARGKRQTCHGLAKNPCSPPAIVRAYLARSEPLRLILRKQLEESIEKHTRLQAADAGGKALSQAFERVQALRRGVSSVWVYLDAKGTIQWLTRCVNFVRYAEPKARRPTLTYLAKVAQQLADHDGARIGRVTPSDLRDLYARAIFRSTGSVIAVMLALGHSRLLSTTKYLDNNILRAENDTQAREFMDHLFTELERGRVDLTILAHVARHGPLTPEREARLLEYRSLIKSRLGVGCADPRHPPHALEPEHIAGYFCTTHRCGLCPHVRYLPESLPGLAMRAEELLRIFDLIPREAWLRLQFDEELVRLESLLDRYYPASDVAEARELWRAKILGGEHRIPSLSLPTLGEEPSA